MTPKSIVQVVAAEQRIVTAATSAKLKEYLNVLNRHCGGGFSLESGNGGTKLEGNEGKKSYTGYIKAAELIQFMSGFIDGYDHARHGAQAATAADDGIQSGDENLDSYVWAVMDEHIEDEFVGKEDGNSYIKIVFTPEDKQALLDAEDVSNKALVESVIGAALVFEKGADLDTDMPAVTYYKTLEDMEADWEKAITEAGGYLEDESGEDEEEDAVSDEEIDNAIYEIIDRENGPVADKEAGDSSDAQGWTGMYSLSKLRPILAEEYGQAYADDTEGYEGVVITYYPEDAENTSKTIVWCENELEMQKAFDGEEVE